jgi:hypothetical protein
MKMNPSLRHAYRAELEAARSASAAGRFDTAFHHLERAHVLSQRHTAQHVYVHGRMLQIGLSTRAWREVLGQASRVVAAALFSRVWVPVGNTGRANVSALRPMPIPADLQALLNASEVRAWH